MDWLWPASLLLLTVLPLMVAAYIWMLRRRRRYAVRFSSLSLVRAAVPKSSWLRRHLPFALFTAAVGSLVLALARPVTVIAVPTGQSTIILAIDVSRSMCATDITPSRLEAAEAAALSFIESQPAGTQFSIVAFGGFAEIIQPATSDRDALRNAVQSLTTGRRTAIGSGILKSIDAIAEIDESVAPSVNADAGEPGPPPVPKGAYAPAIIVLLTDGASNTGPLPIEAAQQAADRGIRVYTIGFGTPNGGAPICDRRLQGGGMLDGSAGGYGPSGGFGGGFSGRNFRRGIDEDTLKAVAELTGAEYYSAESANELQNVFREVPTHLITRHETTEVSVFFTAAGALLAALAVGLSLAWNRLP